MAAYGLFSLLFQPEQNRKFNNIDPYPRALIGRDGYIWANK